MKVVLQTAAALCLWFVCGLADDKNRPVTKVINLLKDMQKQLQKEQEEDESVYDKLACWCETNDKEKTKAVADAEARITELTSRIEQLSATSARLSSEISSHQKEVAANQAALDQATALRQKELANFNSEEKDLLQSVSALKAAITVLSKHHGETGFLQLPQTHLLGVAATLQHELQTHGQLLEGVLSPSERRAVAAFVEKPDSYFQAGASPTFKQAYAPQSGQIFGILRQMLETFESNLSASQKEELANQKAYEELKSAKEEELTAGQKQVDTKTEDLAASNVDMAQAKQDVEDTKSSLSADEQFLMMLKEKCAMTDKEWEERQKTRQEELEAVSKALSVLSSDDAHDTFTRTFNPTLLQSVSGVTSQRRLTASELLEAVATKFKNPKIAALATQVKLDAFTRVKAAIDTMIGQLQKEKADEITKKDFCVDEFHKNQLQTEKKKRDEDGLKATIGTLSGEIESLTTDINAIRAGISEMQVQLKKAGEDREKENKDFQETVADQRETQRLLQAAIKVLDQVYSKKEAFVQQGPAPPAGFKTYEKNAASSGVLGLLGQIMNDAKQLEAEALRAESDAQKAYEDYVKNTNMSIEKYSEDMVNKQAASAKKKVEQVAAHKELESTQTELSQLSNEDADLHNSCDFVVNNFSVRQNARDEEVEALRQAKAILSGAQFQ